MDPKRIAAQLVRPLKQALAKITTAEPYHRRTGAETAAKRHKVRSEASRRAWETIRNSPAWRKKQREKLRKEARKGK
jgi:hypothetical protein